MRRTRWIVGVVVIALAALSGCAGTAGGDPHDTEPPEPTPSYAQLEQSLITGLIADPLTGEGVKASIPSVPAATPLNLSARIIRNRVLRERAQHGGSATVNWSLVASSADLLGVLITTSWDKPGSDTVTVSTVLWFDEGARTVATGAVLIAPEQWDAFTQAVSSAVAEHPDRDATLAAAALGKPGAPQSTGPAIGLSAQGDLIVTFGSSVAGGTDPLEIHFDSQTAQQWLSPFGFEAVGAATHPTEYSPGVTGDAKRTLNTAPTGSRPSADIVGDCKAQKCVALTFDDGPGPGTPRVLEALTKKGAGGTFFVLGNMVEQDPDGVKAIALSGNEVASHTWRHNALTASDNGPARQQIRRNAEAVQKITGEWPVMMRPPYGDHNKRINALIADAGQVIVQWSVDTLDWKTRSTTETIAVSAGAQPGDIVLMHDIHEPTVAAVPGIVEKLTASGYKIVPVEEIASPNSWRVGASYCAAPWRQKDCW